MDFKNMSIEELRETATDLGVVVGDDSQEADIIEALESALGEGDIPDTPKTPTPTPVAVQTFTPAAPIKDLFPTPEQARDALKSHIARGLEIVTLTAEYWHLKQGRREAAGNMKMPLKQLLLQANLLMTPTAFPTEGMEIEEILTLKMPRK